MTTLSNEHLSLIMFDVLYSYDAESKKWDSNAFGVKMNIF